MHLAKLELNDVALKSARGKTSRNRMINSPLEHKKLRQPGTESSQDVSRTQIYLAVWRSVSGKPDWKGHSGLVLDTGQYPLLFFQSIWEKVNLFCDNCYNYHWNSSLNFCRTTLYIFVWNNLIAIPVKQEII